MFPLLKNKKFQDISTGKVITVTDQFEDVAILEGKQRINVNRLLDRSSYTEYIDPQSFFSQGSTLQALAEKIRSIPNEALSRIDEAVDEPAVMPYDPEEEKMQILQKYSTAAPRTTTSGLEHLMEDDPDIILVDPVNQRQVSSYPVERPSDTVIPTDHSTSTTQAPIRQQQPLMEDPMVRLFRGAKRKTDFTVTLRFNDKIPRPDFIEMMEDSYETSIIDFLANEFTERIVSDPSSIREAIRAEIMSIVYPSGEKEKEPQTEDTKPEKSPEPKKKNKTKDDSPVVD
jgi:hypothetical protein